MIPRFHPLFAPATDAPPAGGGTPPAPAPAEGETTGGEEEADEADEEPDPEAPPAEETPAAAAPKLGMINRAKLQLTGKTQLINQIQQLTNDNVSATNRIAVLEAENKTLRAAADQVPLKEKEIKDLQQKQTTVSNGVKATLTTLGVTESDAPGQQTFADSPTEILEKFNAMKGAERTTYLRANRSKLKAAEAAVNAK